MSKLNQAVRRSMQKAVLDHAFNAKEAEAQKEVVAAGVALYMSVHADYLPAMKKMPDGFFAKENHFDVYINGQSHSVELDEKRLVPYDAKNSYFSIEANNQFGDAYLKALEKQSDLSDQRKSMGLEVNAILHSVTTFKKLWEVWPEAKPILEKFEGKPPVAFLPAIQFDKVNAALNLPPSKNDIPWTHRMTANGGYEIGYFGPNGFVKTEGEVVSLETANAIVSAHNGT